MNLYVKIKFALEESPEDVSALAEKFLCCKNNKFTLIDLCWWWNGHNYWRVNIKAAEKLLRTLLETGCCIRVSGTGGWVYESTGTFLELLKRIIRVGNILKGVCDDTDKSFRPSNTNNKSERL